MQTSNEIKIEGSAEREQSASSARPSRKLVWVTKGSLALLDQGLLSSSNFLVAILLARWLTRDQYGAYALAFSIFLLLAGFHNAFLLEPMSVFGPESYSRCLRSYIKKLFGFHFVLTLALSLLVVVGVLLPFFKVDRALTPANFAPPASQ
jgi:hypothetical protein